MSAPTPPPGAGGPMLPSRPLNFTINIDGPPGEGADPIFDDVVRQMPYDGLVSKVYIGIPDGVHSRAGFSIWHKGRGERYFPYDEESDYAAFNDAQGWWDVTFVAEENDELQVQYINTDHESEGHTLKVWMLVVGEEALPASLDKYAQRDGVQL